MSDGIFNEDLKLKKTDILQESNLGPFIQERILLIERITELLNRIKNGCKKVRG